MAPSPSPTMRLMTWALLTGRHRIDAVTVPSESSRSQVIEHYGIPAEKIHVIPYAPDEEFRVLGESEGAADRLHLRYGTPSRFVLSMGRQQPHKNIGGLLEGWSLVRPDLRRGFKLVILARKHWRSEETLSLIKRYRLKSEVLLIEELVSSDDLVRFLNAAELFVFPSLFEGFGLPLVEAMACGTPTIASDSTSIPEVVGDAALLMNPRDPKSIASAIERMLSDQALRNDFSRKALARSLMFSWRKTTQQLLELYESLVDS